MSLLLFTFFIIVFDQVTKFLAIQTLSPHQSVPLIPRIFHFTLVLNQGAAFGILKNQTFLFIASAFLAVALIVFDFSHKRAKDRLYDASLCLIAAGAIGNLIDRLLYGYVIDFLDFRVWPVFNVADTAVSVGAILLGYSLLFAKQENARPHTP